MSLSIQTRAMLDDALKRRRTFRDRINWTITGTLLLSLIPAQWLMRHALVQLKASGRVESLDAKVRYSFDGTNWQVGGQTSVAFQTKYSIFRLNAPLTELSALHDLQRLVELDIGRLDRDDFRDFAFLRGLDDLQVLAVDRITPPWTGAPNSRPFHDDMLVEVSNLRSLKTLLIAGNRITDKGLAKLSALSRLEKLDLEATLVTDAGLKHLQTLHNLRTVRLSRSRVTPAGIQALQQACPQLDIDFDPTQKPFHGIAP